jgi:hypothetical protein
MVVRLLAFRARCPLYPLGIFMLLISVGGSFNLKTVVRLEQLSKLKNPMISSGFEVVTFQLVAWCFSHVCYLWREVGRSAEIPVVSLVPIWVFLNTKHLYTAFWRAISEMSAGTGSFWNVVEQLRMKLNTVCKLKTVWEKLCTRKHVPQFPR